MSSSVDSPVAVGRQGHAARRLLQRDPVLRLPARHLGLQPAVEHRRARAARRLPAAADLPAPSLCRAGRGAPAWRPRCSASARFCWRAITGSSRPTCAARRRAHQADMVVGVVTLVLVFEAARRIMGLALPLICGSPSSPTPCSASTCPGELAHRGYGLDQVVGQLAFGTEGIYGTPTYVSARPTSSCSSCSAPSSSRPA
jgi:hypothetical protein